MRKLLLFCLLVVSISAFGQSLKKKYYGSYAGTIPAYTIDLGTGVVPVQETAITIRLMEGRFVQTIGTTVQEGSWAVSGGDSDVLALVFSPDNSLVRERITFYRKQKRLVREGIYPQPRAELLKQK